MSNVAIQHLGDIPNLYEGGVNDYPASGLIIAVHNSAPTTINGRAATTDTMQVTYDVLVQTNIGYFTMTGAPAQNRWDVWCYIPQPGHTADLHWFGDTVRFTVDEIPVTEDC